MLIAGHFGCSAFSPPRPDRYIEYPVKKGDTLFTIGKRFQVSSSELQQFNKIGKPQELQLGQILRIPFRGQSLARTAEDAEAAHKYLPARQRPKADSQAIKSIRLNPQAKAYLGKLLWPIEGGGKVSSKFGRRWLSFHEGIDISAEEGTPLYACHDGVVVYSDDGLRGYGNLIVLRGNGLLTVYGHNRRNRVKKGERVKRGDRIGDLGQSGKATGPHVHFETRIKNDGGRYVAVDPLAFYTHQ